MNRPCFCGYSETRDIKCIGIQSPFKSGHLNIVKCTNPRCGFIFNNELSSQEAFNEYYMKNDMYFFKKENVSDIVLQTAQTLEKYMTRDSKILDIGCGCGELLMYLHHRGYNVSGVDTSQKCVDGLIEHGVKMFKGDVFTNNVVPEKFDVIILSHVVEHIYDLERLVQVVPEYLKPGGIVYVEVPNSDLYYQDSHQPPLQEYNTEHINHFDEMSLAQLFMGYKLVCPITNKVIQPHGYQAIYGIFTPRVLCDPNHVLYTRQSLDQYVPSGKVSIWCVGEFAYKLIDAIGESNIEHLIDDNKAGQVIGSKTIIAGRDFDYKSNILIASSMYYNKILTSLFFYVFDLDGTLIDSERHHYDALIKAGWGPVSYEEYENLLNTTGIQLDDETRRRKNQHMVYDVQFIKGAEELIEYVYKNNINHVVVTNSRKETVEKFKSHVPTLNKLTNWITREDYKEPKPDPECYNLAKAKFYKGEPITYGFENTVLGIRALSAITDRAYMIRDSFDDFIANVIRTPNHVINITQVETRAV